MAASWRTRGAIGGAVALTLPAVVVWVLGSVAALGTGPQVLVAGVAVFGAAFLLAWGADAAEKDVPQAVAVSVLAVVAVAPEYLVDAFYAWQAGIDPGPSQAAALAIANMTGANRLLIGLGWSLVAVYAIVADTDAVTDRDGWFADAVDLEAALSVEILFLFAATLYGFVVPFNILGGPRGIDALDLLVLVGLYVAYVGLITRTGEAGGEADVGVPAYLQSFSAAKRGLVIAAFFVYAGVLMVTVVEPFAHGLEQLGHALGLPPFVVVQWLAPLASESPELIVVFYLVRKARSSAAFNALLSSKLNQWTLLVGTLVVVYSVAVGGYAVLPFSPHQTRAVWLTAAQSLFAIALVVDTHLSGREALLLLGLFLFTFLPSIPVVATDTYLFIGVYLTLGIGLLVRRRQALRRLVETGRQQVTTD